MTPMKVSRARMTDGERRFYEASMLSEDDKTVLNSLLKQAQGPNSGAKRAIRELRREYSIDEGIGDEFLVPLLNVRTERLKLRARLGISREEEERMFLDPFSGRTRTELGRESIARAFRQIDTWVRSNAKSPIRDSIQQEIEYLEHLLRLERLGGKEGYLLVPGLLNERRQATMRGLNSVTKPLGVDHVYGYNDILGVELDREIASRMRGQRQVNVLDGGCGHARMFEDLVGILDKEFGGHMVADAAGERVLLFGNGSRLKLVGVSRVMYKHPDYVNYSVGDIERIGLKGPFDEIVDVYGAFMYTPRKKELVEEVYHPLLRKEGAGGVRGVARILASSMEIRRRDGVQKAVEDIVDGVSFSGGDRILVVSGVSGRLTMPIKRRTASVADDAGIIDAEYEYTADGRKRG